MPWLREINVYDIVVSPLLDVITGALDHADSFEAAVDCLCAMCKETKEVDEYMEAIETLYPRIAALQPRIARSSEMEEHETYRGLARLFSEAGEAWVVLIARMPTEFRALVECVLECAERDRNRDAAPLTFNFWYEMKMYLVLDRYIESRMQFVPVFSKLVDIMIDHLEFPMPESGNESDLFEGDRTQEDRFRENRHATGDVLKDCCEVIGTVDCLGKSFKRIQEWISTYGSQVTDAKVPHWQSLEAPLFSLRAMGREVDKDENVILPQLMPLLIQVPNHHRIRFTAIMTLGRYSEWTSQHPEFLEPQLNFIISSFGSGSNDIMTAAALALKFFCQDCRDLMREHVEQLQKFYDSVLDSLPPSSQEEISEGVANVVGVQPVDKIYDMLKLYCDPLVKRLMTMANEATDDPKKALLAGTPPIHPPIHPPIRPYRRTRHFLTRFLSRSHPTIDCIRTVSRTECRNRKSASGGQVLARDPSRSVSPGRQFPGLPARLRARLWSVAHDGAVVPHRHSTRPARPGREAGLELRRFAAGMLSLGHGGHHPGIFRGRRSRRRGHVRGYLSLLRAAGCHHASCS